MTKKESKLTRLNKGESGPAAGLSALHTQASAACGCCP